MTDSSTSATDSSIGAGEMETCRIRRWRGYVTSSFYAESETGEVLAESTTFRWWRQTPPPETPETRAAYDALVGALVAEGWTEATSRSAHWFGAEFVRPRSNPTRAVTVPTLHSAPEPRGRELPSDSNVRTDTVEGAPLRSASAQEDSRPRGS